MRPSRSDPRPVRVALVLGLAILGASTAAAGPQWEVQGELQLAEILDNLDRVVEEHASSQTEYEATMRSLAEQMEATTREMKESEPGSPRFRMGKSQWAELMSQKLGMKLAWAEGNVERSREIVTMIEQALGLITDLLHGMSEDAGDQIDNDHVRQDMVRLGAQIGLVLHASAGEWDARTQSALRSVMIGLSELEADRFGTGKRAVFQVYVRLKTQLRGLLEATGDLLARNRLQLARNRVDAERLEAMVVRDLASLNVARLEEYTRMLSAPDSLLTTRGDLFSNADDFAEIEEIEARERADSRPPSHAVDTRDGFSRLVRGGTRP